MVEGETAGEAVPTQVTANLGRAAPDDLPDRLYTFRGVKKVHYWAARSTGGAPRQ